MGCLSLNMIERVRQYDVIITVDAVDGTDADPGTVFRFEPDAMARHSGATASLHDLKLVDLFDAAALLGYEAEGLCLGMQAENPSPAVVTVRGRLRKWMRRCPCWSRRWQGSLRAWARLCERGPRSI